MSRNYSFDMWVPRERLFEIFSLLARYDGTDELAPLIWPDGRRLDIRGQRRENDERDLIPFDGSLMEDFCLSFNFEEDDELRFYNEDSMRRARTNGEKVWDYKQEDGRYRIGCIYISVRLRTLFLQWLEGEMELVLLSFTAATSSISDLFAESPSIQNWFVELAREIGAFSCELNFESFSRFIFLNGERVALEDESSESFDPDDENNTPSLWAIYLTFHPQSEAAQRVLLCERLGEDSSAHELAEVMQCLQDVDSGVRAKALLALPYLDKKATEEILDRGSHDSDWRVRATAAELCGESSIRGNPERLERLLNDEHPEVRISAVSPLRDWGLKFERLRDIVLQTPPTSENLGLIKAALDVITYRIWEARNRKKYGAVLKETLETVLARPDFPFKQMAMEKLNMLRDDASP